MLCWLDQNDVSLVPQFVVSMKVVVTDFLSQSSHVVV